MHKKDADVVQHANTNKHKKIKRASTISHAVTTIFKKVTPANDDLNCSARKVTFTYHTVWHDLRFNPTICMSKLNSSFSDPKFSSAKTKTEAIVVNVIAPHFFEVFENLQ